MSHRCHSLPSGPSDVPLSILIPTYNGRAHLERCLPSVCRHAPPHTQIVVVDDASTDGTASWLRTCFPQVEVVVRASNQGYCAAVNEGLEHVRGEVVELLNNDTEVCAGWADASLRWFADETVGSVAPLVLRMDRPGIIDTRRDQLPRVRLGVQPRLRQAIAGNRRELLRGFRGVGICRVLSVALR